MSVAGIRTTLQTDVALRPALPISAPTRNQSSPGGHRRLVFIICGLAVACTLVVGALTYAVVRLRVRGTPVPRGKRVAPAAGSLSRPRSPVVFACELRDSDDSRKPRLVCCPPDPVGCRDNPCFDGDEGSGLPSTVRTSTKLPPPPLYREPVDISTGDLS